MTKLAILISAGFVMGLILTSPAYANTQMNLSEPFEKATRNVGFIQAALNGTQNDYQKCASLPIRFFPNRDTHLPSEFVKVEYKNRVPFWVYNGISYPSFPSSLMIYRDVSNVTEDAVLDISQRLGMRGVVEIAKGEPGIFPDTFWVREENRELSVWPGDIHYQVTGRPNGIQDELNLTPTEEEAITRAEDFLNTSGLVEPDTISDAFIGQEGHFSNKTAIVYFQSMSVMFYRTIDGIRVFKNDIRVDVGGNGDIIEVTKRWNDYEPDREYPLIPPEEAYQHLLKSDMIGGYELSVGSLYMDKYHEGCEYEDLGPLLVNITNITLEYYGMDTERSGLLRPAYKFEYEFILEEDSMSAVFFVPAVPELGTFADWNYPSA